jgi:hypothetical protein
MGRTKHGTTMALVLMTAISGRVSRAGDEVDFAICCHGPSIYDYCLAAGCGGAAGWGAAGSSSRTISHC